MCRHRRPSTRKLLQTLNRKVDAIMATQADLDAIVSRIDSAVTGIRQDIQDLKDQAPPELDFSALEAKVTALEGLDAENPAAPAEPTEPPAEPGTEDTGNTGNTGDTSFTSR